MRKEQKEEEEKEPDYWVVCPDMLSDGSRRRWDRFFERIKEKDGDAIGRFDKAYVKSRMQEKMELKEEKYVSGGIPTEFPKIKKDGEGQCQ